MTHSIQNIFLLTAAIGALAVSACSTAESNTVAAPASAAETKSSNTPGDMSTLTVNVSGFETQQGAVMVALSDEESYGGGKPVRGDMKAVESDTVTLTFDNLPVGTYAIRMFHDVDGNGEMNMNVFGIPTEPYAFSNNAKGTMGPASWEDAKFDVSADGAVQNITF